MSDELETGEKKVKQELFDLCHLTVKDGHIVGECDTIEASQELAILLMEDVFIRVKPTKVIEQTES